jgi:hypothetical protein
MEKNPGMSLKENVIRKDTPKSGGYVLDEHRYIAEQMDDLWWEATNVQSGEKKQYQVVDFWDQFELAVPWKYASRADVAVSHMTGAIQRLNQSIGQMELLTPWGDSKILGKLKEAKNNIIALQDEMHSNPAFAAWRDGKMTHEQ